MIDIRFYCVQPIKIDESEYQKLLTAEYDLDLISSNCNENFKFSWLKEFSSKNSLYQNFFSLKLDKQINSELLLKDLKAFNSDKIDLSEFLETDMTDFELLFDLKMLYFLLSYEIHFKISEKKLDELLACNSDNIYIYIRKLLVKENNEDTISLWAENIRKETISKIVSFSKNVLNCRLQEKDINIKNNTGNITNIVYDKQFYKRKEKWIMLNESAERLHVHSQPVCDNEFVSYMFYGRFHTILFSRIEDCERYQPIQFHMQYMWYIIDYFNMMLDKLNILIIQKKGKNLENLNEGIYEIINKIQLLHIHNERFASAIEIDNVLIYKKVESKWNVLANLQTLKEYILFFKDYLERVYSKKIVVVQRKQNKILFAISFLQIAALISVWNDYLTLLDEKSIQNVDEILFLFFDDPANLIKFNEYIPLILLIFTIIALIYLLIKKK